MSRPVVSSKNWRYRRQAKPAGRGPAIVMLILIGLLVTWFVLSLWKAPRAAPFVRVLCVERYTNEPQLPFLKNDLDALASAFSVAVDQSQKGVSPSAGVGSFDIHSQISETTLVDFAPYLSQFNNAKSKDIAILYIAAQGVAIDEKPYLLGTPRN